MKYTYTAMNAVGQEKCGTMEGESESDVTNKLKNTGLFPTRIKLAKEGKRGLYDEEDDKERGFDSAMMGMVGLSLVVVIGRENMGISYLDLGLALAIAFCFCWWRAYVVSERMKMVRLQGPEQETKEEKEKT